ncbi:hypothetical protein HG537_0H01130 [Torulaspora globosa]|uniref:Pre-mRNA-splicing factor CWC15 n=1 Tax=Torulaspora globosa TaxID=48254 RepID=A0A7H9I0P7_9SACH|nr:hypothetical protein HG537_0H01130 [Torulaspora sp. CBS 2947]
MTTSHRPQLEARSGAKSAAYVPTGTQHARLVPGHTKLKLRNGKTGSKAEIDDEQSSEVQAGSPGDGSANEPAEEEEDDEEEDDEQEALLQELNRIRQERRAAESSQKDEPVVKVEETVSELTSVADNGQNWRKSTTFGRNRVRKASSTQGSNGTEYQNDLLKSKYHQEFMRRYVK